MQLERLVEKRIINELTPSKVTILTGSRGVGKTHLLKSIQQKVPYKTLLVDGAEADGQERLSPPRKPAYKQLLDGVELLLIDEAQVIPEIDTVLKSIREEIEGVRIIVAGSSALNLANKPGELVAEFANFYSLYSLAQVELQSIESALLTRQNLEERLVYGSYPALLSLRMPEEKANYLRELSTTYLLKDILAMEKLRNGSKILDLLKVIAFQVGKEISLEELGRQLRLSKNTVEHYLNLLRDLFIIYRLSGFSRKLKKEITKTAKWYFVDNGLRNAVINDFRPLHLRSDKDELWESYSISERIKKQRYNREPSRFYFWRTYDQQGISLIESRNDNLFAFECSWKMGRAKPPIAFRNHYPEAEFAVIHPENYLTYVV